MAKTIGRMEFRCTELDKWRIDQIMAKMGYTSRAQAIIAAIGSTAIQLGIEEPMGHKVFNSVGRKRKE